MHTFDIKLYIIEYIYTYVIVEHY